MPFFAVQANDQVMKTRNLNRFFFSSCEFMTFLQFERKETFTMTSYPEAVDHVNDFDEMLHFIIKATASTRATIIHTIITEKSCLQKNEMHKHIMGDDFMQSRTILSIVSQTETDAHDFLLDLDFYDYFRFPILSSVLDTPCRIFFNLDYYPILSSGKKLSSVY